MNAIKTLFILLIFWSNYTLGQKSMIKGNIKGLNNDSLIVKYLKPNESFKYGKMIRSKTDTIYVKNGKFTYTNIDNEPIILEIQSKLKKLDGGSTTRESLELFLYLQPNEKIKIKGHKEKTFIDYTVEGSEISEDFNRLRKSKLPLLIESTELYLIRDTMRFKKVDKLEIEKVSKKIKENWDLSLKMNSEFIDSNWDSHLTPYLLWYNGQLYKEHKKLSNRVRNGVNKPIIDFEIERKKLNAELKKRIKEGVIKEGVKAPNFTLKDIENNDFTLHSATYEYMILDFWGSWCVPCVQGFPKMKEYYKKYNTRLEFIGIACKDREDKWRQSVKKHDVNWTQLFNNPKDKNSDISFLYSINMYPTKIIINKEKKIVGVFEGESEAFYKKLDDLMKN